MHMVSSNTPKQVVAFIRLALNNPMCDKEGTLHTIKPPPSPAWPLHTSPWIYGVLMLHSDPTICMLLQESQSIKTGNIFPKSRQFW